MSMGSPSSGACLLIDDAVCHICKKCQAKKACTHGAIRIIDRGEAPVLDSAVCWRCLSCYYACPFHAVVRLTTATSTDCP